MSGRAEMYDSLRKERESLYGTHSSQRRDMMADIREHRIKEEEEEKKRKANKKENKTEKKNENEKEYVNKKEIIVNEKDVKGEKSDINNVGKKISRWSILWFIIICLIIFIIGRFSN